MLEPECKVPIHQRNQPANVFNKAGPRPREADYAGKEGKLPPTLNAEYERWNGHGQRSTSTHHAAATRNRIPSKEKTDSSTASRSLEGANEHSELQPGNFQATCALPPDGDTGTFQSTSSRTATKTDGRPYNELLLLIDTLDNTNTALDDFSTRA